MVCIYCFSKTSVTNSRSQARLGQTWRRRRCSKCQALFTTLESAELASCLRVHSIDGGLHPFSRDKLYLSIAKALEHRKDAVEAASHLTATITVKILKQAHSALVERKLLIETTSATLAAFDDAARVVYDAFHPI